MPDKKYYFICEVTERVSPSNLTVLHEEKIPDTPNSKVVFKALLQTFNEKNGNGRWYSTEVGKEIVKQLKPRAESRGLLSEVDHPFLFSSEKTLNLKRAATPSIQNSGALIRKIWMEGNKLFGELETLSGFKGPDLANLITKDRVEIGFSLRALGGVTPREDGVLEVSLPIRAVSYDVVCNPSHATAKVVEFLPENTTEFISDTDTLLEESNIELLENDMIRICDGNSCVLRFVSDIIEESFDKVISKKIRFMI